MVNKICESDVWGAISLADYFSHLIPRRPGGHSVGGGGTTVLHTLDPPSCDHRGCEKVTALVHIRTCWPQVLHVLVGERQMNVIKLTRTVVIPTDVLSDFAVEGELVGDVEYQLVGRVIHNRQKSHWTAEINLLGVTFAYDDIPNGGSLEEIGDEETIVDVSTMDPDVRVGWLYVYHRTSNGYSVSVKVRKFSTVLISLVPIRPNAMSNF